MRRYIADFARRHEPKGRAISNLKSGVGAIVAMTVVGLLAGATDIPFLIAPFGATAVLIFGHPENTLSQPANVLGGYCLAALIASLALWLFPGSWIAAVIATGATIVLMRLLRITHPPAGAIPLVAFASHFAIPVLVEVVLAGSVLMVMFGVLHHHLPPKQQYPIKAD